MARQTVVKCLIVVTFLLAVHPAANAQISAYSSFSYLLNSNPLNNFAQVSDRMREGFVDLRYQGDYDASALTVGYVGGMMLFTRFWERDYYEHTLSGQYTFRFSSDEDHHGMFAPSLGTTASQQADTIEATSVNSAEDDSLGVSLSFGVDGRSRYDRAAYQEYDNYGAGATQSCRVSLNGSDYFRASNRVGLVDYLHLPELSNVQDVLGLQLGIFSGRSWSFQLSLGGGLKHYTSAVFDTTQFEVSRTFTQQPAGKGKGGAALRIPSGKRIFVNAQTNTMYQISGGLLFQGSWRSGSLTADILYRHNPGPPDRYLAQYANTSILNADIYSDFFSYHGPEAGAVFNQTIALGLKFGFGARYERRSYGVPALTLTGEKIGVERRDIRTAGTLSLSRYSELGGGIGLDLGVEMNVLRNQSTDQYNDYKVSSVSLQIGVGY